MDTPIRLERPSYFGVNTPIRIATVSDEPILGDILLSVISDKDAPGRVVVAVATVNQDVFKVRNIFQFEHAGVHFSEKSFVATVKATLAPKPDFILSGRDASLAVNFLGPELIFQCVTGKPPIDEHDAKRVILLA